MPFFVGSTSTALTTTALSLAVRSSRPRNGAPIRVSSISTTPESCVRCGATAAGASRAWGWLTGAAAAANQAAKFDWNRAGHIFRDAPDHFNPATRAEMEKCAEIFESVASKAANLRPDAVQAGLVPPAAAQAGAEAFTEITGQGQVWVKVVGGMIDNAGLNKPGSFR